MPVFELDAVSHSYGRNHVIFDVSLSVWPGEVVGLVGDNGAGKSTLLKIFAGYQKPTRGRLKFMGKTVRFGSPADARALGIEAVYQDLAIVNQLNLWQNFYLGKELKKRFGPLRVMDRKADAPQATVAALTELGLTRIRSADEPVWTLSGGERQSVAITRANHFGAKLLLLDEPTAALSVRETRNVLRIHPQSAQSGARRDVYRSQYESRHPRRRPHRAAGARPHRAHHRSWRGRRGRTARARRQAPFLRLRLRSSPV